MGPHFDPYAYETHEDPYRLYRRLRDEAPAYRNDERGFWAISRYDDVRAAVTDWPTFSSAGGITLERRADTTEPMLLEMDPPRHTQLRALVSRAFTPKRVADLEDPVRELARDLVAGFADRGQAEVIEDFSARLPMAVISEMLGVPPEDHDQLRHWSDTMLHREEGQAELPDHAADAGLRLVGYFEQLVEHRRSAPRLDLVSALIAAHDGSQALTHAEVIGFCFLLIVAGNETTTKLIGNAVYWLWRNPDQRDKVLADPALVAPTVEEVLRYDGSTQIMARTVAQPVELHGARLTPGDKVLLLFGSANRDERHWDRPDVLDIQRNPSGHFAFGHGIHHCLGAALARLETRVALEVLLPVLGEYEVEASALARVHSGNVRGFSALPVRFATA